MSHSRLSASASDRWVQCPGSVKLYVGLPDELPHPSAKEGTIAHKLCEDAITAHFTGKEFNLHEFEGAYIGDVLVDDEMISAVKIMLVEVDEAYQEGDELYLEERVTLEYLHPDMYGTSDVIIKHKDTSITIIDFKYGRWPVDPVENSQLIYYFLGARAQKPCLKGTLKIVQPRSRDGVVVKSWTIERDKFEVWEKKFAEAARMADIGTPLKKGDHCRFCRAKPLCPLHAKRASPSKESSLPP